ncbi:sugar transferase [Agromyces bauzanensis]|uniref:Polyprenyl glycosylphosphotransferase n=1 Tax=Agromyces bauzanensis TaxID=1308924 RepID=A0A917PSC3_9MICO|nr:sugar transferase [Agromyces bauzanensis]GGJ90157.1 polyprenyl glycosylphosphotransferase [Agromyces bauzanensis]
MALTKPRETSPPSTVVARWQRGFAIRLFMTDLLAVVVAVFGSQVLRFGTRVVELDIPRTKAVEFEITYTALSVVVIVAWMLALEFFATRDHKVIGSGSVEYRRIADATLRVFGLFAIVAFLTQSLVGRGYLLIALPAGLVLLLVSRWAWRQWLNGKRAEGEYLYRALLMGDRMKSQHVAQQIKRDGASGIHIVGAITEHGTTSQDLSPGIPVVAGYADALDAIDRAGVDTVILTGADTIEPRDMRQLGWDLESRSMSLIVAPALTDVAGPRIHARPVAGLPLIHVEYPAFEGRKQVSKRIFDIFGSLALIALSSPIMVAVAIVVKLSSPGPVFYSQERIGLGGVPFPMLKFRSMVHGADDQLKSLLDEQGTSDRPLFKINNDPRITPVGRFIRRYSLDELPQFFNVLRGDMSLVGPRPQREAEVALYDPSAHRRLMMKPGISGLWQVSGRSSLEWDDAIRLDLYYVENWSTVGDIVILWRTIRAVVAPGTGAH